jgi:hypothetical protein
VSSPISDISDAGRRECSCPNHGSISATARGPGECAAYSRDHSYTSSGVFAAAGGPGEFDRARRTEACASVSPGHGIQARRAARWRDVYASEASVSPAAERTDDIARQANHPVLGSFPLRSEHSERTDDIASLASPPVLSSLHLQSDHSSAVHLSQSDGRPRRMALAPQRVSPSRRPPPRFPPPRLPFPRVSLPRVSRPPPGSIQRPPQIMRQTVRERPRLKLRLRRTQTVAIPRPRVPPPLPGVMRRPPHTTPRTMRGRPSAQWPRPSGYA